MKRKVRACLIVLVLFLAAILVVLVVAIPKLDPASTATPPPQPTATPTPDPTATSTTTPASVEPTLAPQSTSAAPSPTPEPTRTPPPEPTDPYAERVSAEQVRTFNGRGDHAEVVELAEGLALFDITHTGKGHFAVKLRGTSDDLLVNTIGRYQGTVAADQLDGGQYVLDLTGDGDWTITIREPRDQKPADVVSAEGASDGVSPFVHFDTGVHLYQLQHDGKGHFAVKLRTEDGDRVAGGLLANETEPYQGTGSFRIREAGLYLFVVTASGNWSISW